MATTMKRINFYLTDKCVKNLNQTARENGISMSRLIRNFAGNTETVREYVPDGYHSELSSEDRKVAKSVARILAKVK